MGCHHVVEGLKFPVPYITGPEYQLIDNLYFQDSLEKWQMCGSDYAMYTPDSLNCNIFLLANGTTQNHIR